MRIGFDVLSVGRAISREAGGELALIHEVPRLDIEPSPDFQDRDSRRILRANEQLQQLAKNLEVAGSILVLGGPVKETLVRYSETKEDRKSTRLNSSHLKLSRMPSSA